MSQRKITEAPGQDQTECFSQVEGEERDLFRSFRGLDLHSQPQGAISILCKKSSVLAAPSLPKEKAVRTDPAVRKREQLAPLGCKPSQLSKAPLAARVEPCAP